MLLRASSSIDISHTQESLGPTRVDHRIKVQVIKKYKVAKLGIAHCHRVPLSNFKQSATSQYETSFVQQQPAETCRNKYNQQPTTQHISGHCDIKADYGYHPKLKLL